MKKPHDQSVDVYGMGICLYYMLFGSYPFCEPQKTNIEGLIHNIQSQVVHFPGGVSQLACDLILRMLSPKRRSRITLEEIKVHPWLMSVQDVVGVGGAGGGSMSAVVDNNASDDAQFAMDF